MRTLNCLTLLACSCFTLNASAITLATFDFSDDNGAFSPAPETLNAGIALTHWEDLDGTLTDYAGNPDRALGARDFLDGNGFLLTLVPQVGTEIQLQQVSFEHRASSTGPVRFMVFGSGIETYEGSTDTLFQIANVAGDGLWQNSAVEILFWGDGASSNTGTWRIDNVLLEGDVRPSPVPLPAPLWLTAGPLVWLFRPRTSRVPPSHTAGSHVRQAPIKGKYRPTRQGNDSSTETARA